MQTRLRILVVNHSKNVWGAERQLLDLRPRLAEAGVDIVLACAPGSDLADAWTATGSECVPYEPAGALGLREADGRRIGVLAMANRVPVIARDVARIVRIIRAARIDVVESYTLNANIEVVLAGRVTRTPSVLDVHDIVVPGIGRRLLGVSAALATRTIANSRATASTIGRGRVDVVYPGVDVTRFRSGPTDPMMRSRLAADPDRPIVGILGRIDPEKGIEILARAVAALPDALDHTQLVVVGASLVGGHDYEAAARDEVSRLLGSRARFVGPTDDVPAVMRNLDVLVNASRAEPFGLTVLEAQACGVAVVASAAGGIPEFVADAGNGLLFEPGDQAGLTQALSRVLADSALRKKLATEGLRTAAQKSIENQATLVADVYRSACARQQVSPTNSRGMFPDGPRGAV